MIGNGIRLDTHSLARLSIEGFVGDAVREAPGHSRAQYKRADRQSERCEEIDMHVHAEDSRKGHGEQSNMHKIRERSETR
jgi:hypothetical protein